MARMPCHLMTDNEFLAYLKSSSRVFDEGLYGEGFREEVEAANDPMMTQLLNLRNTIHKRIGDHFHEKYGERGIGVLRGMNEVVEMMVQGLGSNTPGTEDSVTTESVKIIAVQLYANAESYYSLIKWDEIRDEVFNYEGSGATDVHY